MAPRPGSEKRRHPRQARRIPCELWIHGVRSTGIVKDVSRGGLFVHTRARAMPGTALTIAIAPGDGRTEIRLRGRVARAAAPRRGNEQSRAARKILDELSARTSSAHPKRADDDSD